MDAPQLCVRFGIRMDETWWMVDESSGGGPGVGALVAAGRGVDFDAADLGGIADGELPEAVSAGPLPRRLDDGGRTRRSHGGGVAGGGTTRAGRDLRVRARDQPPGLDCRMVVHTAGLSPSGGRPATRVGTPPPSKRVPAGARPAASAGSVSIAERGYPQAVIVIIGEASVIISISWRESFAKAMHMATSSQLSQVPWSSPVASSTTV